MEHNSQIVDIRWNITDIYIYIVDIQKEHNRSTLDGT